MKLPDFIYDDHYHYDRMWKDRYIFLSILLSVVLIFGGIVALGWITERNECIYAGEQYRRDTKYNLNAGCYIKDGDRYIDFDSYLVTVNR